MSNFFSASTDKELADLILSARHTLVLVSPGFSKTVAEAVARQIKEVGLALAVSVILDPDPEVCRLGYGEIAAVEILTKALEKRQQRLMTQSGLRIGLVVADSEIFVFSPTPQLIEASSKTETRPNAIRISSVIAAVPAVADGAAKSSPESGAEGAGAKPEPVGISAQIATALAASCGVPAADTPERPSEIGSKPLEPETLAATKKSLEEIPPRKFDVARRERVFSYQLEFVELSMEHYKLSGRSVSLSPELLGLDHDVEKWHNSYRPFDDKELQTVRIKTNDGAGRELAEDSLTKAVNQLRKKYLISLPGYGSMIIIRHKAAFLKDVEALRQDLGTFKQHVEKRLARLQDEAVDRLVSVLLPRVRDNPPERWEYKSFNTLFFSDNIESSLRSELQSSLGKALDAFDPEVKCLFKGVTYGTIKSDEEFQKAIAGALGPQAMKALFEEHDSTVAHDPAGGDKSPR